MHLVTIDPSPSPTGSTVEKWTPERRRARTRAALVSAARLVFARKGFEGASLDEIAATAGYTRGAIYKHFDGKEDLLFAVYDLVNEQALERFSKLFDIGVAQVMDPATIVDTWRDELADDVDLRALDLEFQLYVLRHPEMRARTLAHRRHNRDVVVAFMRAHSTDLETRVPLETLTSILLITADAFSNAAQIDPEAADLYQVFLELFLPTAIHDGGPALA